jgi:hypothetical protein
MLDESYGIVDLHPLPSDPSGYSLTILALDDRKLIGCLVHEGSGSSPDDRFGVDETATADRDVAFHLRGLQYADDAGRSRTSKVLSQADPVLFDLPLARIASKLHHDIANLPNACGAHRVPFRL